MKKPVSKGFTLIEILIALVILAVGLTALVVGGSELTSNTGYLKQRSIATWLADDIALQYRMGIFTIPPSVTEANGKEQRFKQTWQWQLVLLASPEENLQWYRVTIKQNDIEYAVLDAFKRVNIDA